MKIFWILFKQNIVFNIISILSALIFSLLILVLVVNVHQSKIEIDSVSHFKDKNLYKISDNLYNEKETEFFSKSDSNSILNRFANSLANSSEFLYYNANWQPVEVSAFKGDIQFDAYYETGNNRAEYEYNNKKYRNIKSMQLSSNVFEMNNVTLSSGEFFSDNDYFYDEKREDLPVILGSDYSEVYKLGDRLDILYYQKSFTGTVIGFLTPNQTIMTSLDPQLVLNRYIVIPALFFDQSFSFHNEDVSANPIFFKASLLSRINGNLISELSPLEIRNSLDAIKRTTGFTDFSVIGAKGTAINTIIKMTETNKSILYIGIFVSFVIIVLVSLVSMLFATRKNVDTYKVMLISGSNENHIYKIVGSQTLLIHLIVTIVPSLFLFSLINNSFDLLTNYLSYSLFASLFMTLTSVIIAKICFMKVDIIQQLKG
ncbi:ABC transporter ATP-binding protein [Paenibacillus kobensis]|uniref:ABC transporter ATP-binding protein n=1 Tax=Paenibacillus kobensis TaxID=59841 RepID=UPI000FDBB01C|nr:ABC transporter ATP-binding protein [Paenibacillus kobensis]